MEIGQFRSYSSLPNVSRNTRHKQEEDEEALKWAVLERLPTHERAHKGLLHGIAGDFKEIDLQKLGSQEKKELLESVIKHIDQNESYLKRLKRRIDRYVYHMKSIVSIKLK